MAPRVTFLSDEWKDDGSGDSGGRVRFNGSVLSGLPPRGSDVSGLMRTIENDVDIELKGALVVGFTSDRSPDTRGFKNLTWTHPDELKSPVSSSQPPGVPRVGFMMPAAPSPFARGGY